MRVLETLSGMALWRALAGVGRRPILVVTDRYPPHAHGGAEVSLHIALSALPEKRQVLVVSFGDGTLAPERYEIDGISVLQLPRQARWPHHHMPQRVVTDLQVLPAAARERAAAWLERAASGVKHEEEPAVRRLVEGGLHPRGGLVVDFIEYPEGLAARLLHRVIEQVKPDVVHADNYRSILIAAEATRGLPVRRIGVVRDNRFACVRYDQSMRVRGKACETCELQCAQDDLRDEPETQRALLQRSVAVRQAALRAMDRVVVTSEFLRQQIEPVLGSAERIVQIANTPDDYELARDAMLGVAELPGTNLLVVGMLNENKGQLPLVASLDALVSRVPDAVLHFAGRGDRIQAKIRELAESRGWTERLVFHGYVNRQELYALYRECQIVALPTVWPEPFGRVPLEAGLARRPVVSFAVGGLRESIRHRETGYLVRPGDMAGFADAVARLADDPVAARKMGQRAHDHIVRTYRVETMREKIVQMWERVRAEEARHG